MSVYRRLCNYLRSWLVNGPGASYLVPAAVRRALLRSAGAEIGKARILPAGTFHGDLHKLQIGDGVFINTGASLYPTGGIVIGDNVHFGPNCTVMTGTHPIGTPQKRAASPTQFAPVEICAGTWIGASVTVCPGVTIGEGCVVAPGAVVVKDLPPNGFYAGVPARLKDLLSTSDGEPSLVPADTVDDGDRR